MAGERPHVAGELATVAAHTRGADSPRRPERWGPLARWHQPPPAWREAGRGLALWWNQRLSAGGLAPAPA